MLHQTRLMLGWINLPKFLEADTKFCWLATFIKLELRYQFLGKRTARTFPDQHIFAEQSHAARIVRTVCAIAFNAHVASCDTNHSAFIIIKHFSRRKARIDFNAKFFSLGTKPTADIAKRHNVIAMIVHQWRHGEIR